jgi:transcriptional regulator
MAHPIRRTELANRRSKVFDKAPPRLEHPPDDADRNIRFSGCTFARLVSYSFGKPTGLAVKEKNDVWQGTLALMVLQSLEALGPQHGYGIARRIEQISEDLLSINQGTLYPVLLKLEQEGAIRSEWGVSENHRRAKFYRLTRAGRKQLESDSRQWQQTIDVVARFLLW